jgi:hypothetical protein
MTKANPPRGGGAKPTGLPLDGRQPGCRTEKGGLSMHRTSRGLAALCKTLALLSGLSLVSVIAVQGLVVWALNRAPDPPPSPDQLDFF